MIGEDLAVGLELVVLCLFSLDLLGGSLTLEDGVANLCPPLADGLHAKQGSVLALLDDA